MLKTLDILIGATTVVLLSACCDRDNASCQRILNRERQTCPGNWLQIDQLMQRVPTSKVVHPAPIITVKV